MSLEGSVRRTRGEHDPGGALGQRRASHESNLNMIKSIVTIVLYAVEMHAWAMINAGRNGWDAESDAVWRAWGRVERVGLALEAWVYRGAERLGIDMSGYMFDRADGMGAWAAAQWRH